jgi:competence ComEA-like helix-hairpin-helix protein
MIRSIVVLGGLALAALAVFHPAPRPPQVVAVATAAPDVGAPRRHPSSRRPHRRRRPRHKTSHRRGRHTFDGVANVNTADAALLGRVPGIGPALAARIVALRNEEGAYASLDELLDVAGMNASRLERARPYLTL